MRAIKASGYRKHVGYTSDGSGARVWAIKAQFIDAIDIDNWCYLNSLENVERNNCQNISVYEGDANLIKDRKFDIILANINRNILLNDINTYASCLNKNGVLFLSGFYKNDIPILEEECRKYMLKLDEKLEMNNWVSLKFLY